MIKLDFYKIISERICEKNPLIQVILGPRQVGKTTTVEQVMDTLRDNIHFHYAAADAVFVSDWSWIERQWRQAEAKGPAAVLILDEIQKVENWSEMIKKLWDEAKRKKQVIKVILLGSSSLDLQKGLSESLTGRFELIRAYHWNFQQSYDAFGYSLDEFLYLGGYPGADQFKNDEQRWLQYMQYAVVETVLERDIAQHRRIARPALFKQVFELLCLHPSMELSLRKIVGQLQNPGSVETVKHYIELLENAFLVKTLQKFSTNSLQKKSSSPKILPLCPALCTFVRQSFEVTQETRGHLFELIVGLDLLRLPGELYYWREDQDEVDYIVKKGKDLFAIEVKSGRKKSLHGLSQFKSYFPRAKTAVINPENYLQFSKNPGNFLNSSI